MCFLYLISSTVDLLHDYCIAELTPKVLGTKTNSNNNIVMKDILEKYLECSLFLCILYFTYIDWSYLKANS